VVQKKVERQPKRRGRPRAYDPEVALQQATHVFWNTGYAGTTLDDLAAATGMNRPSLFAAFGDKHALYITVLKRYWELGLTAMRETFIDERPLREALMAVYDKALDLYIPVNGDPRGCFAIGTAVSEAVEDPAIRAVFADGLRRIDEGFAARLRAAQQSGELGVDADPAALALFASAVMQSLAVRSRSGTARPTLEAMARKAIEVICS
jgi:TetR/AcrR family transcriptional regulator, copper-responsive repressor